MKLRVDLCGLVLFSEAAAVYICSRQCLVKCSRAVVTDFQDSVTLEFEFDHCRVCGKVFSFGTSHCVEGALQHFVNFPLNVGDKSTVRHSQFQFSQNNEKKSAELHGYSL